jgi:hypothetical protein
MPGSTTHSPASRAAAHMGSSPPALSSLALLVATLLGLQTQLAFAGMYKCFDSSGNVTYTDGPCLAPESSGAPAANAGSRDAKGGKITKEQVLAMLQASDRAAMRMDIDAILSYMTDDVVIELTTRTRRGPGRGTIGKREFRRRWMEGKEKIRNYRIQRDNIRITINPDERSADVSSTTTEYWNDPGGPMMMVSEENSVVELRGGRPKVRWSSIVFGKPEPPH